MKREPTSWKILLMPVWMLSVSFGMGAIMLLAAPIHGINGALCWAVVWMLGNLIPGAMLFQAYDMERTKRREIENRWRKDSEHTFN